MKDNTYKIANAKGTNFYDDDVWMRRGLRKNAKRETRRIRRRLGRKAIKEQLS